MTELEIGLLAYIFFLQTACMIAGIDHSDLLQAKPFIYKFFIVLIGCIFTGPLILIAGILYLCKGSAHHDR